MYKRHLQMAVTLLFACGLSACGGGAGSLPPAANLNVNGAASNGSAAATRHVTSIHNGSSAYGYSAPWGGFGGNGQIYVLAQGQCHDIGASPAGGVVWPSFLNTLKPGTAITIVGTPSYANAWAQENNCPTGGIVATNVTLGTATPAPNPASSATPGMPAAVQINAGGSAVATWTADSGFTGGFVAATLQPVSTASAANPAPQNVYQSNRYGRQFAYTIAHLSANATYIVRLHFAETYFNEAGKRVFGASINGRPMLANFDIFAAAGGANVAVTKQFASQADLSGVINITFAATVNNALVSGIEVMPGTILPTPVPTVAPSAAPTAMPTAPPNPGGLNYPAPFPQWQNAIGLKTIIDPNRAAAHIKSYDAGAMNFYSSWNPNWSNIDGGVAGWDSQANYAITSGPGEGFYVASNSDPTYDLHCYNGGYCGYTNGLTGMHIPYGARTQNSGTGNCDCHIYVLQPVGWTPGSVNGVKWPKLAPPYQYEIDIENAATSQSCEGSAALQCTTFTGGGQIYAWGSIAYSTGSTGWYGGKSPANDGFSPANSAPAGWGGSADHSNTPYTSLVVSAQDVLQGAINHETALGIVCSETPQSDNWPAAIVGTDYPCSNIQGGMKGWSYGDHIWLQRTPAEIRNDVANHILTTMQGMLAMSFAQYGTLVFDNAGNWGPTFLVNTTSGDPLWSAVGDKYGLPRITKAFRNVQTSGVLINLSLPMSYMKAYAHAIDSCVVRSTC